MDIEDQCILTINIVPQLQNLPLLAYVIFGQIFWVLCHCALPVRCIVFTLFGNATDTETQKFTQLKGSTEVHEHIQIWKINRIPIRDL